MSQTRTVEKSVNKTGLLSRTTNGVFAGFGGLAAIAGHSASAAYGYYEHGSIYGRGAGVAMGLGESFSGDLAFSAGRIAASSMFTSSWAGVAGGVLGIAAYGLGKMAVKGAYEFGKSQYRSNREINMGRRIEDTHGTIGATRMKSIHELSRSRAGLNRSMGNEARFFHR